MSSGLINHCCDLDYSGMKSFSSPCSRVLDFMVLETREELLLNASTTIEGMKASIDYRFASHDSYYA